MARTNFFTRPIPDLLEQTINLPAYGEITLVKMDTALKFKMQTIYQDRLAFYTENAFPLVGGRIIDITPGLAASCASLAVMQKPKASPGFATVEESDEWREANKPYSFEELAISAYTDEDQFNMLMVAANTLNNSGDTDPKALKDLILGALLSLLPDEASTTKPNS